jgi:ABC-type dipeptide/oligopeptide/nickel transport system permease component
MTTFLVRRLLLFIPTIIGATMIVFMLMFLSPVNIIDSLMPPEGQMQPGVREQRRQYLDERYGLNKSPLVQYVRWLNNISPVGFAKWDREDPKVRAAAERERSERETLAAKLREQGLNKDAIRKQIDRIDYGPDAGGPNFLAPRIKAPDLGESFIRSRSNAPIIWNALPVTITLQVISLPIAITLALLSGIYAAKHRGKIFDVASGSFLLALYSVPVIWVGVLLIGFLANVQYVKAFPTGGMNSDDVGAMSFFPTFAGGFRSGFLLDSVWHLILPVICVSYGTLAYYSKLTRTSLLETLSSDMVRTARSKGLSESTVLYRHALRNSLMPLITVAASFLPLLVSGSIVIETIFGLEGMGRLAIESLKSNDRELFLSVATIILVLQLIGYLLADIAYVIADPRVSYD